MTICVFEDDQATRLHPITLARPAYAITCGAYRLIDWLRLLGQPLCGVVRHYLQELQRIEFADLATAPRIAPHWFLNARLIPSVANFRQLQQWMRDEAPGVVYAGDEVAGACLPAHGSTHADLSSPEALAAYLAGLPVRDLPQRDYSFKLFTYPHDVIRENMQILGGNLEHRLAAGGYQEIRPGVFAAGGAVIADYVVTDTKAGPIVLDEHASIGPFCYLRGPAYVGHHAKLIEHAAIKDAVSAGHTTKIGGEVEAAVIEPFTNKQHHGFLGHSYLGSWINLGAGTCNSDLKNTYGKVNLEYRGEKVSTGMQFVGCIMGDYAKTAINTGIFTGKIIGACSMLYGFVTTNVPSFVNYARLFGQVTELPPEVMVAAQHRMFNRRSFAQRPCDVKLIHDMFELTRAERQLAGEPISL
ncbi:MAG: putative sugar nucleotidyl transferase [Pirellulaceae bacterium]